MKHEKIDGERCDNSYNRKKITKNIGTAAVSLVMAGAIAGGVYNGLSGNKLVNAVASKFPILGQTIDNYNNMAVETITLESNPENARNIDEIESLYYEDENGRNMEFSFYSLGGEVLIDEEAFLEQIQRSCELADEKYGYEEFDCVEEYPVQKVIYIFCDTNYVNYSIVEEEDRKIIFDENDEIIDIEQFRKYFTNEKIEDTSNRGQTRRIPSKNIDIVLLPTAPPDLTHVITSSGGIFKPKEGYAGSNVNDLITLVAGHEALHVVTVDQASDNLEIDPDRIQNKINSVDAVEICDKVVFYIGENSQ